MAKEKAREIEERIKNDETLCEQLDGTHVSEIVCIPESWGVRVVAEPGETLGATLRAVAFEVEIMQASVKKMVARPASAGGWEVLIELAW